MSSYVDDTMFELKETSLDIAYKEVSYVIYDYTVQIIDKNDPTEEIYLDGQIRLDKENGNYMITYFDMDVPMDYRRWFYIWNNR